MTHEEAVAMCEKALTEWFDIALEPEYVPANVAAVMTLLLQPPKSELTDDLARVVTRTAIETLRWAANYCTEQAETLHTVAHGLNTSGASAIEPYAAAETYKHASNVFTAEADRREGEENGLHTLQFTALSMQHATSGGFLTPRTAA